MTFGLSAAAVGLIGAGATVVGAAMGANASKKAAAAQAASADAATQLQREQFDKQIELNEPFRQGGLTAQNRLMYLLGLDSGSGTSRTGGGTRNRLDSDTLRQELQARYTTRVPGGARTRVSGHGEEGGVYQDVGTTDTEVIDERALQAEIDRRMAEDQAAGDATTAAASKDPAFGSLMRDFSMADYEADPGYAFRQSEGLQALERSAAARGGLLSGRAAKDTMRYSQGLASQEYGNAYNRFQINRSNKINPLQALMGSGQTATGQQQQASQNYASNAGNNIIGAGNARASGIVGGANAVNSGISTGWNMYQGNRLIDAFESRSRGGGGGDSWRTTGNGYDN
jgi:hypothetical protein